MKERMKAYNSSERDGFEIAKALNFFLHTIA